MKKNAGKRFLSMLLCLLMVVSMLPVSALALEVDMSVLQNAVEAVEAEEETVAESLGETEALAVEAEQEAETLLVASGTCGENAAWTLSDDGVLTISGSGNILSSGPYPPWKDSLDKIVAVNFVGDITCIGPSMFAGCTNLTTLSIPGSVKEIGSCAFSGCTNLVSVSIEDGVEIIHNYVFEACTRLEIVSLPSSISCIRFGAFLDCRKLKTVYYDGNQEQWNSISIDEEDNEDLFAVEVFFTGSITCGDNLTWTLSDDGVLTISGTGEMWDFRPEGDIYEYHKSPWLPMKDQIRKVVIESGVTSIGEYAFSNCNNLTDITIPDSVTTIGILSFEGCESLTEITIGNGVTTIGEDAFFECSNLTEVTIGDSVASIGRGAFFNCSSIASIIIPDSVTTIESRTFALCSSLTSITIPDSVTSIGDDVFLDCDSLADVYYTGSEEQWNGTSIGDNNECLLDATIHFNYTMPGDLTGDGVVTAIDLVTLMRNLIDAEDVDIENADLNSDGSIDILDIIRLLKYLAGEDVELN